MSEICGDCERDFEWEKDDDFWDEELQMYICSTCVCVRSQSQVIDMLRNKIERLERAIEQNQIHEMDCLEVDAMDRGCR